ncbi:hypothetical protein [Streptomyces sp. ISL-100]|uniref:hypothetical protein n=1 Tax=Streptomyces sp. ISL-100 TaxID=2819173 RepID=UPI001BE993BB|nr:hypothetical protein [Streptomyces sp. ISL-100]MBT2400587.1 hypothetical protein [Streptomyces sp. ISL-100]
MVCNEHTASAPALPDPNLEPVPVDGCGVCAALAKQRETARTAGSPVTVRSCNAELQNHPHRRSVDRK